MNKNSGKVAVFLILLVAVLAFMQFHASNNPMTDRSTQVLQKPITVHKPVESTAHFNGEEPSANDHKAPSLKKEPSAKGNKEPSANDQKEPADKSHETTTPQEFLLTANKMPTDQKSEHPDEAPEQGNRVWDRTVDGNTNDPAGTAKTRPLPQEEKVEVVNDDEVDPTRILTEPELRQITEVEFQAFRRNYEALASQSSTLRNHREDGANQWGVLTGYVNPDAAIKALGGIPVVHKDRQRFLLREIEKDYDLFPLINTDQSFSDIVVRGRNQQLIQELSRRQVDELWYYFMEDDGAVMQHMVSETFNCQIESLEVNSDLFIKEAKLRGAVEIMVRPGGGSMGVLKPVYFEYHNQRLAVDKSCLQTYINLLPAGVGR